jgi:hypothetical protein
MANWRNWWTKPSHGGIAHDVWTKRVPVAVTNRDWKPDRNDIKVHNVILSEISWFVVPGRISGIVLLGLLMGKGTPGLFNPVL